MSWSPRPIYPKMGVEQSANCPRNAPPCQFRISAQQTSWSLIAFCDGRRSPLPSVVWNNLRRSQAQCLIWVDPQLNMKRKWCAYIVHCSGSFNKRKHKARQKHKLRFRRKQNKDTTPRAMLRFPSRTCHWPGTPGWAPLRPFSTC